MRSYGAGVAAGLGERVLYEVYRVLGEMCLGVDKERVDRVEICKGESKETAGRVVVALEDRSEGKEAESGTSDAIKAH
ncbi:hypothetical protein E2C01_070050 [Portunus trituberculatus]|uniref:Uncharacterized protein n=1 Tax=Portunus trituberculatus TaxID=210409 RepID=A0A5B7I2I5_PORTR|nr:hypothetical protein [Portunus trituberculatus]